MEYKIKEERPKTERQKTKEQRRKIKVKRIFKAEIRNQKDENFI